MTNNNYSGVAFLSPYPPRQCGIATFTDDLFSNVLNSDKIKYGEGNNIQHNIIALENEKNLRKYGENGDKVITSIKDDQPEDYRVAADKVNRSLVSTLSLQHEYNLYGGHEGEYVLEFLEKNRKPVVTTMHTVQNNPSRYRKEVTAQICDHSEKVIVMAEKAADFLRDNYNVPERKIKVIPHGIHPVSFSEPNNYKELIGEKGRKVILTFGLLDHLKGVEYAIDAMEEISGKFPESLFIVLGATHPVVKKQYGEEYRESLIKRVKEKGLENNVKFHDEFVTLERLIEYLMATDIFITPYLNKERITSGALAYALACGKAIVSTPYYYAEELLSEERGRLVPFRDSSAIAREIINLLEDENNYNRLRKNAYQLGLTMWWWSVAEEYSKVFAAAHENSEQNDSYHFKPEKVSEVALTLFSEYT